MDRRLSYLGHGGGWVLDEGSLAQGIASIASGGVGCGCLLRVLE